MDIYKEYGEVSGLKINIQKSEIMCINTPLELVSDIKKETGIKIATGMRHLGIELRENLIDTKRSTYEAISVRDTAKKDKINNVHLDLFHKRQLIMHVIIPSYSHKYTSIGYCQQHGEQLDEMCRKVLWTKKVQGGLQNTRRMVAKKRLAAGYEYEGMQMQESESIAEGLSLHILQRVPSIRLISSLP